MQLMINIDEDAYNKICTQFDSKHDVLGINRQALYEAIKNGTVLREGHGRIGDLDELIFAMKERNEDNGGVPLNAVDRGYDLAFQHMCEEANSLVLIPADKKNERCTTFVDIELETIN